MEALTIQRQYRLGAEERTQWIAQYRSSQLSARKFAQQHGLNAGTLCRWMRAERERTKCAEETPGFQEIHLGSLPTGTWAAEVVLPGGIVVRLGATASAAWMRWLWDSLRSC
jgi:transposase-like protein